MTYNFSKFFKDENDNELDDFVEQYSSYINVHNDEDTIINFKKYYQDMFDMFRREFNKKEMLSLLEELSRYKVSLELPYVVVTNELYSLKNIILTRMLEENDSEKILELLPLFKKANNQVAHIYLTAYIKTLLSTNNVRLNSLSDLIDKSIIKYYESHLIWISDLATCIRDKNQYEFPELDEQLCTFGSWLNNDAKTIIQNNSKHKTINTMHSNLHFFGRKIHNYVEADEHHLLITYLEKCEFISLGIGTELALLNNILLNKKVDKDALTGALSRESLANVFESQYELSLATDTPFVLAMCDLDHFKNINDTYGHVVGDKVLQSFVCVVKEHIRNSDMIIRYGGEEFVILLPAVKKEKALSVLQKVCNSFKDSFVSFDGQEVKSTVSIGVTEIKPEEKYEKIYLEEYVAIADRKLYRAKNDGRNRIVAF